VSSSSLGAAPRSGKCSPRLSSMPHSHPYCSARQPGVCAGSVIALYATAAEGTVTEPDPPPPPEVVTGTVISAQANFMRVLVDETCVAGGVELLCVVRAVLKKIKRRILVGDQVQVGRIDWDDKRGAVEELCERRNHVLEPPVANVDRLLILFALTDPPIEEKQLTQFLVSAEALSLPEPPLLVLNKADLVSDTDRARWIERMQEWGYEATTVSVWTGEGIQELLEEISGSVTVLAGPSGVGKSSMVNAMRKLRLGASRTERRAQDREFSGLVDIATKEVGAKSGRGRHTTRHCELLPLPGQCLVADTPGFGLPTQSIDALTPVELMECFPEIRNGRVKNGPCAFSDCTHQHEPGCVIGQDWERHDLYSQMVVDAKANERKRRDTGKIKEDREEDMRTVSAADGGTRLEPKLKKSRHRRVSRRSQMMEVQALVESGDDGIEWEDWQEWGSGW